MARAIDHHEDLSRPDEVKRSSDRTFGLVFTIVFLIVGLWPLAGGGAVRLWALGTAAAFLATAFLRPKLLAPFNRLWTKFGLLLHSVAAPVVMGLLFYLTVTPIGLIMRLLGKDPLRLRFEPQADSYWIVRRPPGPAPDTMKNQF